MSWTIHYAQSAAGKAWVHDFLIGLSPKVRAKTMKQLLLLQQIGPNLGPPLTKKIREDLYEFRVVGKEQIRILFTVHSNAIILLHGVVKKSWKLNLQDIKTALNRSNSN